jgi:hypothetical protein
LRSRRPVPPETLWKRWTDAKRPEHFDAWPSPCRGGVAPPIFIYEILRTYSIPGRPLGRHQENRWSGSFRIFSDEERSLPFICSKKLAFYFCSTRYFLLLMSCGRSRFVPTRFRLIYQCVKSMRFVWLPKIGKVNWS